MVIVYLLKRKCFFDVLFVVIWVKKIGSDMFLFWDKIVLLDVVEWFNVYV